MSGGIIVCVRWMHFIDQHIIDQLIIEQHIIDQHITDQHIINQHIIYQHILIGAFAAKDGFLGRTPVCLIILSLFCSE